MPITALPTPPERSDPANFASRGDAFMTALPTFATEANALAVTVNADAATASAAASTATTQAGLASTSASNASTSASTATTKAAEAAASALAAMGSAAFVDSNPVVKGSADATKQVRFEVDALTTATTRVLTVPDADLTIVGAATTQTLTNKTLTAPVINGFSGTGNGSITGTLTVSTGAAVGGATAGASGLAFPATAVPSADANTLDDYEEGTWTPVIAGSTVAGTGTYTAQIGRYTKKGREVTCLATVGWSAHTGTGNMLLTGLPFTAEAGINPQSAASCATLTITGQLFLEVGQLTAGGSFFVVNNGALSILAMDTAATVYLQFTYNV